MKILKLSAENIKRLSVVEITPDGSPVIVIGGKNGAGKSSVLDAIAMAIGGADMTPDKPVRRGQERGKVVVDLGDIVVTRTFTAAGGGSLIVANKDGARYGSPQALLDKLIGRLSFDPLDFERMKPAEQRETLRSLVGLDTADLESEASRLFADRTVINRTVKQLEGQVANLHHYPEAPAAEVSIADLSKQLEIADESRRALDQARAKYETAAREYKDASDVATGLLADKAALHEQVRVIEARIVDQQAVVVAKGKAVEAVRVAGVAVKEALVDAAPIRARLLEAESVNQQVRANLSRREALSSLDEEKREAQALTDRLAVIEREKRERLAAVRFPMPGIGLDETGVTLDGVPFGQASQAERLRASVAMGLALNPQLKVLLVREGSSLDTDSMALLGEIAAAADAQVWVERVAESREGVSVLIENGAVKPALSLVGK